MKYLLIVTSFFIFITSSTFSNPALSRGSKSVGGGMAISRQGGDLYYDYTSMIISTKYSSAFGYGSFAGFVIEVEFHHVGNISNTDYAIGFIYEKYFSSRQDTKSTFPFLKLQTTIGSISEVTNFSLGLNLGIAFMISDAIAFEIGGVYSYDYLTANNNSLSGNMIQAKAGLTTFVF